MCLDLSYSLMLTLPGTPVIRYGDEIGMGDDLNLPESNCARTPMQWSTERQGGITTSSKPVLPVITGGAYGFEHVNVAAQRRDPDSLLNWMERVFRMRKEVPEIGWGDFKAIPNAQRAVLVMRYQWRGNVVVFAHNLSEKPLEIEIGAKGLGKTAASWSTCSPMRTAAPTRRESIVCFWSPTATGGSASARSTICSSARRCEAHRHSYPSNPRTDRDRTEIGAPRKLSMEKMETD